MLLAKSSSQILEEIQVDKLIKLEAITTEEKVSFNIEVANNDGHTWSVKKTIHDFDAMQSVLLNKGYFVPLIPRNTIQSNEADKLRRILGPWLEELVQDDEIRQCTDFVKFFAFKTKRKPESSPVSMEKSTLQELERLKVSDDFKEDMKPVRLKDFALLKVIGKGSFGKVMLVRKRENNKIYAMKVLQKDNVIKRNQVEHTKTERSVLGQIIHPFIVTLRFAFQTKRKLYFVMDYCPGGELFFHLGRAGRFSEQRSKYYAAQMITALEYLHSKDIVYRDLKPENVLLDAAGNIQLTDFGLSKEGIADNTSAHSFCGTPEYLAPEILTRAGHGRAADWWSLGALLYEMLTGMPPFYSRNRDRLFHKILKATLRMPRFFSPAAKSLLLGLLDRNPTTRLGSTNDAAEIKSHAFFRDLNWDKLAKKQLEPPFVPELDKLTDTVNFDAEFTSMPLDSVEPDRGLSLKSVSDGKFVDFTFVNQAPESRPIVDNALVI